MKKPKGYSSIAGLENITRDEIKERNLQHYGSKIKSFRKKAGLSVDQLAEKLEIAKSTIQNWECGLTRPDPEYLYRMFTILDVEPNEFFGLKGIGTLLTAGEKALVNNYRMLDKSGKEALETFADAMSKKAAIRQMVSVYDRLNAIPDWERCFAAGDHSTPWEDYPEKRSVYLYDSPLVQEADEVITVSGASMEPQFYDGDRVLIKYCTNIRTGDIGCFYVPGIVGVSKQKLHDRLHSLNPDYDDILIHEEGAQLIGRALCVIDKSMLPGRAEIKIFIDAVKEKEKHPEWFE